MFNFELGFWILSFGFWIRDSRFLIFDRTFWLLIASPTACRDFWRSNASKRLSALSTFEALKRSRASWSTFERRNVLRAFKRFDALRLDASRRTSRLAFDVSSVVRSTLRRFDHASLHASTLRPRFDQKTQKCQVRRNIGTFDKKNSEFSY